MTNYMSLVVRKTVFGVSTRSHSNQAVQPHKMARGLKFLIKKVEGLYYLCSENKGADQLPGNHEADQHLCFRICKKPVFSRRDSYDPCHEFSVLFALCKNIGAVQLHGYRTADQHLLVFASYIVQSSTF